MRCARRAGGCLEQRRQPRRPVLILRHFRSNRSGSACPVPPIGGRRRMVRKRLTMTNPARSTPLGKTGPRVFPVGLGCMAMSGFYGPAEDGESVATLRHAIDRGVTLLDTGDFYGMGHN